MVEFCKCGSLIVNGSCSKKGCAFASQNKDGIVKAVSTKKARPKAQKATKSANPRMSSKCITYNLYEINEEKKENTLD